MATNETYRYQQEYELRPDIFDDASMLAISGLTGFIETSPARRTVEVEYAQRQKYENLGARALGYSELVERPASQLSWDERTMTYGNAPAN